AAASADAVVVAVGEKAYAEGLGDNPAPQLTPDQQSLVSALEATGKPVIVVVVAGRPLGLGPAEQANAILMAYQGSTEAGQDVVPVYVHQPVSVVVVPPQRLVGFARVTLNPGQTKTVHVAFRASALAVTPGDINGAAPPQVELGAYQVQIGTPASLSADFTIHS